MKKFLKGWTVSIGHAEINMEYAWNEKKNVDPQ